MKISGSEDMFIRLFNEACRQQADAWKEQSWIEYITDPDEAARENEEIELRLLSSEVGRVRVVRSDGSEEMCPLFERAKRAL